MDNSPTSLKSECSLKLLEALWTQEQSPKCDFYSEFFSFSECLNEIFHVSLSPDARATLNVKAVALTISITFYKIMIRGASSLPMNSISFFIQYRRRLFRDGTNQVIVPRTKYEYAVFKIMIRDVSFVSKMYFPSLNNLIYHLMPKRCLVKTK